MREKNKDRESKGAREGGKEREREKTNVTLTEKHHKEYLLPHITMQHKDYRLQIHSFVLQSPATFTQAVKDA